MVMYYTKEYLSALAPKIRMQAEAFDAAMAHFDEIDPSEAEEIARFLAVPTLQREEKDPTLYKIAEMENGDLLCVLLYMAAAGYTHENYKKKGIPDSIFYDSFNCLAEKMETAKRFTGKWNYPSILWPSRMTCMQTFRIGRLSFAMERAVQDILNGDEILIEKGARYVHIHIADNDKLCGCEESVRAARAFFAEFYPEYKDAVFYTRTWLMDPRLAEILPPESNIMQFQKVFHIIGQMDNEKEVLARIFGPAKESLDDYVPTSSLARAVLARLKRGEHLGSGWGYTRY